MDLPPSGPVPEHPLIPGGEPVVITDREGIRTIEEEIRRHRVFAFDTEFIGESSYDAQICLVQVATPSNVWLIDPLLGADFAPIRDLVADPDIRTIVHAGQQDLEPVARLAGRPPASIIDTQILAGFARLPYPINLRELAGRFAGVRLGKAFTFTRWDARPLARSHLAYAADDVRYLFAIEQGLMDEIGQTDQRGWALAACAELEQPQRYRFDAASRARRLIAGRRLSGRALAALIGLIEVREVIAQQENVPPRTALRDDVLVRLAKDLPKSEAQLVATRGLPRPVVQRYGARLLDAIARAVATPSAQLPERELPDERPVDRVRIDALWALCCAWCHAHGVDPAVVASRREAAGWYFAACSGEASGPAESWRRELLGEPIAAFLRGDRTLGFTWADGPRVRSP